MRLDAIRGALRGGQRSNAWLGNLDDYDECAGGKHRGLEYVVLSTDRGVGLCLSPDEVAAVVRVADRIRRRTARAERKRKDAEGARTGIDLDKRHDR